MVYKRVKNKRIEMEDHEGVVRENETPTEFFHRRNYKGQGHRNYGSREFIAWDGEGIRAEEPIDMGLDLFISPDGKPIKGYKPQPQPYVLLANSKGGYITKEEGLSTEECFDLLLQTKQEYPNSIFVGFSFNYDINQMLKDVHPVLLKALHQTNETAYKDYFIRWYPRKSFYVRHRNFKRGAILYDVFGFFQKSFLKTCEEYLGKHDPDLQLVAEGKAARDSFSYAELNDFILPYCLKEVEMTVRVMNQLREDLHSADMDPGRWHGPGAIASRVFTNNAVPINREIPKEVQDASQFAYAGGRFEQFRVGRYPNTVWEYDIRSAYPAAATHLPDISQGHWEHADRFQPGTFAVWNVSYRENDGRGRTNKPQPLFCRAKDGRISYPCQTQGWYWTPEASLVPDSVTEGWVYRPDTSRKPFSFIEEMYEARRAFRDAGNSTERALKLCMNSIYGKTAQTIGSKDGAPKWHQLEYAGYITSYVRALIYNAMKGNEENILATETDAVFSTCQLQLDIGSKLGQWEEKKFDEICYLQSGFYYAFAEGNLPTIRFRGMDRSGEGDFPAGLPPRTILDHLRQTARQDYWIYPPLFSSTTRYIGLGLGLQTNSVWRSWEAKNRTIRLNTGPGDGKRYHLASTCSLCRAGLNMYDQPHPMNIGGYEGKSYARYIPWRELSGTAGVEQWEEMDPSEKIFADDMENWNA